MTIETKYNGRDTVWFLYNNEIKSSTVRDCSINIEYKGGDGSDWGGNSFPIRIMYRLSLPATSGLISMDEKKLFKTKEELIASL